MCADLYMFVYGFRKSDVCRPDFDDSSSVDECCSTNKCLPRTTSDGHKAKVVRKSRKLRKHRAFSFNCKQLSVAIQTDGSSVVMPVSAQQPACDGRLVSSGTQTDDVIVISVSEQLHASSDVPDGLFRSGHGSLLPAIRTSNEHSASYDRDTDSGHMSDTEGRLLRAVDRGCNEVMEDADIIKSLSVVSVYHDGKETSGDAIVQATTQSAELVENDNRQLNKSATMQTKISAAVPHKLSSSERGPLSRWTTATRLDVLDNNDGESKHPETFFAPLETSTSQLTALNDVNMSGISVLSNHSESHLPLSSQTLSVTCQAKSSASHLHSDVIMSSSSSYSQSSAVIGRMSKQSDIKSRRSNSSNGGVSRPSAGTGRRISKGLRKPRVSVGRKSLPKHQSSTVRDKCHPTTKISRPAAWLMNATKASRSKVR